MGRERIRVELDRLFENVVGLGGVKFYDYDVLKARGLEAVRAVYSREQTDLGFLRLPYDTSLSNRVQEFAEARLGRFENFVALGIGGSALGAIMLQTALTHPFRNLLEEEGREGWPRLFVPDNVDPWEYAGLMDVLDLKKTLFNVITKSGSTAETMAAYLIIRERLESALGKEAWKNHLVITTDSEKGDLRRIAEADGIESFEVPGNVGGRFSVLSSVGLLPAAFLGVEIDDLLEGAADMIERCRTEKLDENPAYAIAATQYLLDTRCGKKVSVMMPYSERLRDCADWHRQLWAESLGKKFDRNGQEVLVGQTPVNALGATDQHSQIQLYVEGPHDKVMTFLRVALHERDIVMPAWHKDLSSLGYLGGQTMGALLDAEFVATRRAVTRAGRPNMTIEFPAVNAFTLGQFIALYETATAIAGELYNVNAFDQPGVEAGKKATYALMGRAGYEKMAEEIRQSERPPKWVI